MLVDIPQKADFLFVHSTTDDYVVYGHEKKGFISKLVDDFIENLNENHLEDVLLGLYLLLLTYIHVHFAH